MIAITIHGPRESGKTTIANAIKELSEQHGQKVIIMEDNDRDVELPDDTDVWIRVSESVMSGRV